MKLETESDELEKNYMKIGMLSPERVLEISCGEVLTSETLNYRNHHPSSEGLFSEKIFGPMNDWECRCGKYQKAYYRGIVCDRCDVEVTSARVRRERFGHIELGCNIVLPQYFYGNPSILSTVLDLPQSYLENIVFFNIHIDIKDFWSYDNKLRAIDDYTSDCNLGECGTNGLNLVLESIDLKKEIDKIEGELENTYGYLAQPFLHRKEILESFIMKKNKPSWMIVSRLLVMPAGLRPIIEYNGKLYSSEINDKYRLIIQRCQLLTRLIRLSVPHVILVSQKRMIQLAVDALFDSKIGRETYDEGMQASLLSRRRKRFKRYTEYSAAGMVISDTSIDIERIGIPSEVAMELFRPFVERELVKSGIVRNIKGVYKCIEKRQLQVFEILQRIENTFTVLVTTSTNRVSALHVQTIEGDCFKINPMIYRMWELDRYDNKKIKIYVQLSDDSAKEAIEQLGIKNQIISDYSEELQILPSQYAIKWFVEMSKAKETNGRNFISKEEAYCAFENGCLGIAEVINIYCHTNNGFEYNEKTTLGRIILNDFLPQNMGVVNRVRFKNKYMLEHNYEFNINTAKNVFYKIYNMFGSKAYLDFLRKYEEVLYKYYDAVDIEYDEASIFNYNIWSKNSFAYDIEQVKKRVSNMKLGEKYSETIAVQLQYLDSELQEYIKEYLVNRKIAKNVYVFADLFLSEGDILTKELIKELYDENIENISIYTSSISKEGIYGQSAFGRNIIGNPFRLSVLAINDVIGKMSYFDARSFYTILLSRNMIKQDKGIQGLIKNATKEGAIGNSIVCINDIDEHELDFAKLNYIEISDLKTYLLYLLLQKNNLKISVRLLELAVKAMLFTEDYNENAGDAILPNENNNIQMYGEYALKASTIALDSNEVVSVFGKVNIQKNKVQSRVKNIEKSFGNKILEEDDEDSDWDTKLEYADDEFYFSLDESE